MSLRGAVMRKGAKLTFTSTEEVAGSYDPTTDTAGAAVEQQFKCFAMQIGGDPKRYQALELKESEAPTLLVVPETIGGPIPPLDALAPWGQQTYAVRDIDPLAMNGVTEAARVIIAR